MNISVDVKGFDEAKKRLLKLSKLNLTSAIRKNITEMFNRGANAGAAGGGTPVDTGELRISRSVTFGKNQGSFGYSKEYAPHVEYGHRTRGGGYVPGQHFLKQNAEAQAPTIEQDFNEALRKAAGK